MRLNLDLLARRKARADGDEAIAIKRDQLERDGAGAVARSDRIRNDAGERRGLLVLGGDRDPPGRTARIRPWIKLDMNAQLGDYFSEVAAEALCPHAEAMSRG